MTEIFDKVKEILSKQLRIDIADIDDDSIIVEDLGADSLDTVELVMAFEEKFSVEVPDEDAEKLKSVEDVVAYIKAHQA